MIDFQYLTQGLNALARAHHMGPMAGHLGASLVAGYFVGEQRANLDPAVNQGIESDLDRVMRGGSVFGKKMSKNSQLTDPELFAPFPKEKPDERLIDGIAGALENNIDKPRQSGHNVIFATIAIRALKGHPELATPSIVGGIRKLVSLFDNATPGNGYYGKTKGRIHGNKITLPDDDTTPAYSTVDAMANAVLDELIALDPATHRQGYGGLVHINNHAAAIADLQRLGYPGLVPAAIQSHHHHLRLWRNLPDLAAELGPLPHSPHTPHDPAYWTGGEIPYDRALLTHRVKTMFGFDELALAIDDGPKESQAYQKLRYLM